MPGLLKTPRRCTPASMLPIQHQEGCHAEVGLEAKPWTTGSPPVPAKGRVCVCVCVCVCLLGVRTGVEGAPCTVIIKTDLL